MSCFLFGLDWTSESLVVCFRGSVESSLGLQVCLLLPSVVLGFVKVSVSVQVVVKKDDTPQINAL